MKRHNYEYLKDSVFLKKFDEIKIKTQYVKISILDFDEREIQQVQGKVISGNFTIDGSSSMRRTCNLTLVADNTNNDLTNVENILSINKKIEVLVGFKNTTDKYREYPILWFPQGLFLIISSNINRSNNSYQISLTLHDKMALLNGQCGGIFPASVSFHQKEEQNEDGIIQITKTTIFQAIQQLMNHFGKEPLHKIIISDIDNKGKSPQMWVKKQPLYLFQRVNEKDEIEYRYSIENNILYPNEQLYKTFNYGEDVGYKLIDAIFPNELVANAGETITSVLDKIKNILGNYEYFYDIDGNFVFQEIKNYLNNTYTPILLENNVTHDAKANYYGGKEVYSFENANLIQSYTNNPQYQQIKNDFLIWGKKKLANGVTIPIRYHIAIDQKPAIGNEYEGFFTINSEDRTSYKGFEIPNQYSSFEKFPQPGHIGQYYYAQDTGYIYRYVIDNEGKKIYKKTSNNYEGFYTLTKVKTKDYRSELYLSGKYNELIGINRNDYYAELKNEWEQIYNIKKGDFFQQIKETKDLNYFLDLLNNEGTLAQFSVQNIGRRTLVINDDNINCIFEPQIVNIYMINENNQEEIDECKIRKLNISLIPQQIEDNLITGGRLNSAYQKVRAELANYLDYNNQVSITALPIYHLEPNTMIYIRDDKTNIIGYYMIKTITLPIRSGDTMNITCTKAIDRI